MTKISIAIHGGAGTILKEDMTPELEAGLQERIKGSAGCGLCRFRNWRHCGECGKSCSGGYGR